MCSGKTWQVRIRRTLHLHDGAEIVLAAGSYELRETTSGRFELQRPEAAPVRLWYSTLRELRQRGLIVIEGQWP